MRKIILASASSGRKNLMDSLGIEYFVEPSNYEEDMSLKLPPEKLVKFLSNGKAEDVAKNHKDTIVIGADTIALQGKEIFGKPKNKADAKRMLKKLSGKQSYFVSGYTVIDTKTKKKVSGFTKTKMFFRKLSDKEIESYIESGQGMKKAGGYIIPGLASTFIKKVEGDFDGIYGLSMFELEKAFQKLGTSLFSK